MQIKFNKLWYFETRDNEAVCVYCGSVLENLDIKSCEIGGIYCSEKCAKQHTEDMKPEDGY